MPLPYLWTVLAPSFLQDPAIDLGLANPVLVLAYKIPEMMELPLAASMALHSRGRNMPVARIYQLLLSLDYA